MRILTFCSLLLHLLKFVASQQVQTASNTTSNEGQLVREPVRTCVSEDTSVCFQLQDLGTKVEVTMEYPKSYGWVALGLGLWMANSDMVVGWYHDGNFTVSDRKGYSNLDAKFDKSQDIEVDYVKSKAIDDKLKLVYRRLKDTGDKVGDSIIDDDTEDFIWAYCKTSPSTAKNDAAIELHDLFGRFRLNMFKAEASKPMPTDLGTAVQSTANLIHGVLLVLSWNFIPFFGILAAGPLRLKLGRYWFKVHYTLLGIFGPLVAIVGVILAIVFKVGLHFNSLHEIIGLVVIILMALQVGLGILIDRLYDANRQQVPWYDKAHWWIGRLLYLLAQLAIMLGFQRWESDPNNFLAVWIVYSIVLGLEIGLYLFLKNPTKNIKVWLKSSTVKNHAELSKKEMLDLESVNGSH